MNSTNATTTNNSQAKVESFLSNFYGVAIKVTANLVSQDWDTAAKFIDNDDKADGVTWVESTINALRFT